MSLPPPGLTTEEARRRLATHGPNEIRREHGIPAWRLFASQFTSPFIALLAGACGVAAVLGEAGDAVAIGTILVLNGVVGFLQEHRAERALLALRTMTAPRARVRRDGRAELVPAAEIVPGDLLVLEAGDLVAADARLRESHALSVVEAALTGESLPVEKSTDPVSPGTPLAERRDSVFMGTAVATGTGLAEVGATGMDTELGRIAHLLAAPRESTTPLQRRLARVGRTLLVLCLAVVAVVATIGFLRGVPALELFLAAVSLAVAAVPEGLPAIVTVALALGVQRMARRHVLIRRLPAVETLGCATVICTDKTGTLTTGVMAVRELWGPDSRALLDAAAACCDAEAGRDGRPGVGDPTELAILAAAAEHGIDRTAIERERPRVAVEPFDFRKKRMTVRRADGRAYVKGALEALEPELAGGAEAARAAQIDMAERGLRVLAVAVGEPREAGLRLLGLVGIADPPRPEVVEAIASARAAGVRTVMLTGDHPATAHAIARELGILEEGAPPEGTVHARVVPERKVEIVREWKARGAVVAMTGDGVNDAPALRAADIGIAMGKTGTEVTREASDMVLVNDDFASIVAAIAEGRGVFDNIRKTLVYLLTGNSAELVVMLVAALAGLPLPLLPLHLLWINLVTDGLPALALVMDPADPDVLRRPPRDVAEPMLGRAEWRRIVVTALVEAAVTLAAYLWGLRTRDLATARNLAFSTLVLAELLRSFAARSATRLFWRTGVASNLRLVAVVGLSLLAQVAIHHVPLLQAFFGVRALEPHEWLLCLGLGLVPVTALELAKLARR